MLTRLCPETKASEKKKTVPISTCSRRRRCLRDLDDCAPWPPFYFFSLPFSLAVKRWSVSALRDTRCTVPEVSAQQKSDRMLIDQRKGLIGNRAEQVMLTY